MPAQQCTLGSPISLSQVPPKVPTLDESEAAETLLSLFSTRLKSVHLPFDDHNMDINFEIQAPSVSTAPDIPLSPFFFPGDDYDMNIDAEILALTPAGLGVSTGGDTPLLPFAIPGDNLPSSGCDKHQDSTSNDQIHLENDMQVPVPRFRKDRTSKVDTMLAALDDLRRARISVMDLVLAILSGEFSAFYSHRLAFLCDSERIRKLLDIIWSEKNSHPAMEHWVQDDGIDHICNIVGNEMESAKPLLKMKLKAVSPEYIEQWDVAAIMDPVSKFTPTWTKILYAASKPHRNESEDARNRPIV
jgi:hypothetical protein